ncbi:hypothetical protein [Polystyrenella longa]|nr:hypothetical protein [Polystyrenella longa]
MLPISIATNEPERICRWMATALWSYTSLFTVLLAIRLMMGWQPNLVSGLTLFSSSLVLSLLGSWLYRKNIESWSMDHELINGSCTLLPVTLIGLFTVIPSSSLSLFATSLGIMGGGAWQIYQAGKAESEQVSSEQAIIMPVIPETPLNSETAPSTSTPPVPEQEILEETADVEELFAEVNLIPDPNNGFTNDFDTRIIEIPEEISQLPDPSSPPTHERNGHKFESCCADTDRSYDLFAEQTEWVIQQFRRTRRPSGCEAIEGYMKLEWEAGQKRQSVHVPFYPPFAGTPEIYCEQADDSDVRLKVAESRSYGVRIEVCLTQPAIAGETTCLHLLACVEKEEEAEMEPESSALNKQEEELVSQAEQNGHLDKDQEVA